MTSWSDWKPLPDFPRLPALSLAELLDGGQAFRWHRQPDGTWQGVWSDYLVRLKLDDSGLLSWSAPRARAERTAPALARYLGLDASFHQTMDLLPWRSDAHLARCLETFPGLRILHQPFGETLLCFLCSATKQIVQIKQMVALLAQRHGAEMVDGVHRLPSWRELADVSEEKLRACLLGFRAAYIRQTARYLAAHEGWLDET